MGGLREWRIRICSMITGLRRTTGPNRRRFISKPNRLKLPRHLLGAFDAARTPANLSATSTPDGQAPARMSLCFRAVISSEESASTSKL
jgi:hypothetical protein